MNLFQDAVTQSTRDWPSERFELLWQQVVVAAPIGPFTIEQVATMPVITRPDWGNVPASAWVQIAENWNSERRWDLCIPTEKNGSCERAKEIQSPSM